MYLKKAHIKITVIMNFEFYQKISLLMSFVKFYFKFIKILGDGYVFSTITIMEILIITLLFCTKFLKYLLCRIINNCVTEYYIIGHVINLFIFTVLCNQ